MKRLQICISREGFFRLRLRRPASTWWAARCATSSSTERPAPTRISTCWSPACGYDEIAARLQAPRQDRHRRQELRGDQVHPRRENLRHRRAAPRPQKGRRRPTATRTSASSPGPQVTLEEDLGRRDFTCNSIAVRLSDGAGRRPAPGAEGHRREAHRHDQPGQLQRRPAARPARRPLRLGARLRRRQGHLRQGQEGAAGRAERRARRRRAVPAAARIAAAVGRACRSTSA